MGIAFADISGYRVKARYDVKHRVEARYDVAVTPHSDAGSSVCLLRVFAFADISGYRVKARYDVEHRIKRGMTWRSPRTAMRGPVKCLL